MTSEVFVESVQHAASAFGMSPAFVGFIIVALVGGAAEMVAVDAKNGKVAWRVPRKPFRACYSTPFVLEKTGVPKKAVAAGLGIMDKFLLPKL